MYVNATDFRNEFSRYLELSKHEDIYILRHGELVATLSGSKRDKRRILEEITGAARYDGDREDVFRMRLDEL
ncbi:MAG: type II toxin-antitoxin system Phd/YefM family antitoxin [Methanomassiliicoccaceae archaeon]|nr:type II toxin-antitoxin system Phd/YefM family antitoxin [Methanomassiliicoccaceae archaeon]